jgi:hypothetical protein
VISAPARQDSPPDPPPRNPAALVRFFAPLALQSASQGLTYPLVAMVASRGDGGALNLAGLAQSTTVMFLLGTLGFGLVTTGMVFAKSAAGFRAFQRVCWLIAAVVLLAQALLCLPQPAHLLFAGLIGLPPSIELPARISLLASLPIQLLFFLRIPYQVAMYNGRATGLASIATLLRIGLTLLLSPLFCRLGWVGPLWAIVCLTIPVGFEVLLSGLLARPFLRRLAPGAGPPQSLGEIFRFNLPLSVSGYLLALAAIVLGAVIARAAAPEQMLPVYSLALGLATPLAYGATRLQEVVLAFPPRSRSDRQVLYFALAAGAVLGALPLVFILPRLAEFYYIGLQKLPAGDLHLVRWAALALAPYPLCVAFRAQCEGLAALVRLPAMVVYGQAMFMLTVAASAGLALTLGLPGFLIGAAALCCGNLASSATTRFFLNRTRGRQRRPLPGTAAAQSPIR